MPHATASRVTTPSRLSRRAAWAEGQPISELMSRALADPNLISLAAGFVDQQTLPVEPTAEAFRSLFADAESARAALQYGTTPGYPPLREALLNRFLDADETTADDAKLSIDQVVLTAGSNQLLHLVCESLLDPGDIVLCASPTYLVFLGTLGNLGARSVAVETDEHGIVPEAIDDALRQIDRRGELERVKAIYVTSYFDNPCGITTPAKRRAAIVELAKRWSRSSKIYVIEDAAYRELRYWGDDVPSLRSFDDDGRTVVVAGTFSKSYSPGIRVGWGFLPPQLVAPVCNQKGNIDFGSPNFSQHLMAHVMDRGLFDAHVKSICTSYREKLEAMLAAADRWLTPLSGVRWLRPTGGLYVWLQVPDGVDTGFSGPLFDAAIEQGVLYVPGEFCYPAEGVPASRSRIRLSFGVQSCERIAAGIEALARAIRAVAS